MVFEPDTVQNARNYSRHFCLNLTNVILATIVGGRYSCPHFADKEIALVTGPRSHCWHRQSGALPSSQHTNPHSSLPFCLHDAQSPSPSHFSGQLQEVCGEHVLSAGFCAGRRGTSCGSDVAPILREPSAWPGDPLMNDCGGGVGLSELE